MDINRIAFGPTAWTVVANDTAKAVTATKTGIAVASPKPAQRHVVTGFSLSVDQITTASAKFQIKDGTTVIFQYEIPIGWYGPFDVELKHPYACAQGANAVATCAATLGTGVVCSVVLRGMTVSD